MRWPKSRIFAICDENEEETFLKVFLLETFQFAPFAKEYKKISTPRFFLKNIKVNKVTDINKIEISKTDKIERIFLASHTSFQGFIKCLFGSKQRHSVKGNSRKNIRHLRPEKVGQLNSEKIFPLFCRGKGRYYRSFCLRTLYQKTAWYFLKICEFY